MSTLPAIDCVVRLSTPVNTKAGPATCSSLKKALRVELLRLFAGAQRPVRSGKPTIPATPASGGVPSDEAGNKTVPSTVSLTSSVVVPGSDAAGIVPAPGEPGTGVPA